MIRATIRQCAVLVGGLGTRLGALTAQTPKPLLPVADRPFLAWLLREFTRFGVSDFLLLTGHLSDVVENAVADIQSRLPNGARITLSQEPLRAGTGGAVYHARDRLDQRFLLCNGDSLFDGNLAGLLAAGATDEPNVIGRMMLRRLDDASRFGVVALDGDRVTAFHERPPPGTGGTINAGVYLFDRRLVDALSPACSLEGAVMPELARRGALRGTVSQGFFLDIGVPEDFAAAQTAIPAALRRRTLFLDRDGVINIDHGYVGSRDRFDWVEGALPTIVRASQTGWHVFIVTNQSGVARGRYDEAAVWDLHTWIADQVRSAGGTIDGVRYCPFHPLGDLVRYRAHSDWRKPEPGMLLDLIREWELDPARCLMIGDQETDIAAAHAAGVEAHRFPGGDLAAFASPLIQKVGG